MYQPEFIARNPASRTSSSTKTLESGTFFTSLTRASVDVDPLSGPRRFERGFDNLDSFCSVGAIDQRRRSHFNGIEKCRELGAQRFFRRKLQLLDRASLRFDFAALGDVTILESFDFVLRNVVIANRGRIFSDNCQLADFSRPMITGLDRRQNRRTFAAVVFQNNQRLVIHFAFASEKISHHRVHSAWRSSKKKMKQIDEMNAVREGDSSVLSRAFEAAEVRAQHLNFAETILRDRVTHPD